MVQILWYIKRADKNEINKRLKILFLKSPIAWNNRFKDCHFKCSFIDCYWRVKVSKSTRSSCNRRGKKIELTKTCVMCENICTSRASTPPQSAVLNQPFRMERKSKQHNKPSPLKEPECFVFISCWQFHSISGPGMRCKSSEPTLTFQVIYHCCRRPRQDLIRLARAPITESDNKTRANQHVAWAFNVTLLLLFLF